MRFPQISSVLIFVATALFARESNDMTITVLFDNSTLNDKCKAAWGFACLLETENERLIFDTGDNGDVLLDNFKALEIDPGNIDKVVLSHMHNDHCGGVPEILKTSPDADIYVVESADDTVLEDWQVNENKLHKVKEFSKLNSFVYSLGEMPGRANEQSIVINAKNGIYLITGCAHPGIIKIIEKAKKHFENKPVKLVLGGFHLFREDEKAIEQIIQQFKDMGVEKAGPTHCSGEQVIENFAKEYSEDFVKLGVGYTKKIEVN